MEYTFSFIGGKSNPSPGEMVQFRMFLINGGKEISFHQAKKLSFVERTTDDLTAFTATDYLWWTPCNTVKIFLEKRKFGGCHIVKSFFIELSDNKEAPILSIGTNTEKCIYSFKTIGNRLSTEEALDRVYAAPRTIQYLENEEAFYSEYDDSLFFHREERKKERYKTRKLHTTGGGTMCSNGDLSV